MSERFPSPAALALPASLDRPAGTARRRRSAFGSALVAQVALAALVLGAVAAPAGAVAAPFVANGLAASARALL